MSNQRADSRPDRRTRLVRHRTGQALVWLAALVLLLAGLKVAQGFFVPILLAFFIATASFPITGWLHKRKVPRSIAVMLTVLVDFAFLTGLVFLVFSAVGDFQAKWNSEYSQLTIKRLKTGIESISDTEARMRAWWNAGPLGMMEEMQIESDDKAGQDTNLFGNASSDAEGSRHQETAESVDQGSEKEKKDGDEEESEPSSDVASMTEELLQGKDVRVSRVAELVLAQLQDLRVAQVWNLGTGVLGSVLSFLGTTFIVIILTVFMLSEAHVFGHRIEAISNARGPNVQNMISALRDTQRYLGIKTAISLATGIIAAFLCWAAGIDFWLLWGILAFALNFIPVVGSIIAAVPPTLLTLLVNGPTYAIVIAAGYFLINTFLGNFLEPMLMGRRFGLSTLVVLISVIFWGWLWGPMGALLAVPLTMMVKVILDNSVEFRWISVAIGTEQQESTNELRALARATKEALQESDEPKSSIATAKR